MQKTEPVVLNKKLSPFEIADGIFMKTGMVDPLEVGYDSFMMNRIASNNKDTVFFADALNKFPGISKQMSYRFYYDALDKGKRYGKWHKQTKHDEIACIAKAYGVNKLRAAQYHSLLDEDTVKAIIASQEQGGRATGKTGKTGKTAAKPAAKKPAKR